MCLAIIREPETQREIGEVKVDNSLIILNIYWNEKYPNKSIWYICTRNEGVMIFNDKIRRVLGLRSAGEEEKHALFMQTAVHQTFKKFFFNCSVLSRSFQLWMYSAQNTQVNVSKPLGINSVHSSPWTDLVVGGTWETTRQRISFNVFYRPFWTVLPWTRMSALWCCPPSAPPASKKRMHKQIMTLSFDSGMPRTQKLSANPLRNVTVSYTHLRAHET